MPNYDIDGINNRQQLTFVPDITTPNYRYFIRYEVVLCRAGEENMVVYSNSTIYHSQTRIDNEWDLRAIQDELKDSYQKEFEIIYKEGYLDVELLTVNLL